jgi:hypothetical protein
LLTRVHAEQKDLEKKRGFKNTRNADRQNRSSVYDQDVFLTDLIGAHSKVTKAEAR